MALIRLTSWLFSLILLVSFQGRGSAQNYGDLRLLQGDRTDSSFVAGRLEIFINSTWGSICADNFNITDAHVACRQLGFVGAVSTNTSFHTPYGRGREGPIWLDEVSCTDPNLMHILSCPNTGLGEHDCDHFSDVAVVCIDEPRLSDPEPMDVRLREGTFPSEGRLEIFCNDQWEVVCNQESFQKDEADAVCRQLGFTEASGFSTEGRVGSGDLQLPVWQGQLDCPVNESSVISSCGECPDTASSNPPSECSVVTVQCAHTVPYGSLRLVQGNDSPTGISEGRLEIFKNGLWGTVCSSTFDILAANISCRQLGFVRAVGFDNSTDAGFGVGTDPVLLTGFECSEDSQTLIECSTDFLEECDHSQDVAVFCTNFVPMAPPNVTLAPTDEGGLKISTSTFIGIMVGSCLLLLLCCICCAVCSIHFYLVPYDTKKENHGLYFIERESNNEAETSLDDQKIDDMEAGVTVPGTDGIVGKTLDDDLVAKDAQRKRKKNKYVSLDTTRGSLVPQPENLSPQTSSEPNPQLSTSSFSVPQPADSAPAAAQSAISQVPLAHQSESCKVSVHSLNLPGTPKIAQPRPRDPMPLANSKDSLDSVFTTTTSLTSYQASQASLSGTMGPIPTPIPTVPPTTSKQRSPHQARVSLQRTSLGDDYEEKSDRYQRASSAEHVHDLDQQVAREWESQDRVLSTDAMIQPSTHATPSKSIIKSSPKFKSAQPHPQSMPSRDGEEASSDSAVRRDSQTQGEARNRTQSTDSMETRHAHNHHVSFLLD